MLGTTSGLIIVIRQNCTYQKCVMVSDGLNENDPDLETQGEHQQDHLSLLIIHSIFHTSQKRCRWQACDEKLGAAILAGQL